MVTEQAQVSARSKELVVGREYGIESYPNGERVSAAYLGRVRDGFGTNSHIFSNSKSYIFINNSLMNQEKGIVTNNSMSPSDIKIIDKEKLRVSSKLIKMLEELGEII